MLFSLVPLEQSQAQLFINVYPSQDNPTNQTLWIFSGRSIVHYGSSIRSSQNFHKRDSWVTDELYEANKPTNQIFSLSPLFSSSNTKDIESVTKRLTEDEAVNLTLNAFPTSATNDPTITIGNTSRPIANFL